MCFAYMFVQEKLQAAAPVTAPLLSMGGKQSEYAQQYSGVGEEQVLRPVSQG